MEVSQDVNSDVKPIDLHNFVRDDKKNFRGEKRARITCTNIGCTKRQVPLEVQDLSKICKGPARVQARGENLKLAVHA